jgi:hypothetical protein
MATANPWQSSDGHRKRVAVGLVMVNFAWSTIPPIQSKRFWNDYIFTDVLTFIHNATVDNQVILT